MITYMFSCACFIFRGLRLDIIRQIDGFARVKRLRMANSTRSFSVAEIRSGLGRLLPVEGRRLLEITVLRLAGQIG